jgi:peptidoglycan/LPS O-acetylase OafA/YrhL
MSAASTLPGTASKRQRPPPQAPQTGSDAAKLYRADVDGMRAIAVLAVVFYHLGIERLSGGYVGVDVFFVISGYLIGGIVYDEMSKDAFSFTQFYLRRARRILPALAVMLAGVTVAAFLILVPVQLVEYGRSVIATVLFVSNLHFYETSSYFGGDAHSQPLLHTWSLAVEEQYYLILPIIMLALRPFGRRVLMAGIGVLAMLSLAASVIVLSIEPAAAFYLLPTRLWELLLGLLVARTRLPFLDVRLARELLAAAGLLLIVGAVLLYDRGTPFPGLAAVPPSLGTAILLAVGAQGSSHVGKLLSHPVAVFFGLISYSLYLWHWPVIVLLKQGIPTDALHARLMIAAFALSTLLAWLSWRFVEQPWRRGAIRPAAIWSGAAASGVTLGATGLMMVAWNGFPARFSPAATQAATILNASQTNDFRSGTCFISSSDTFADFNRDTCLKQDPARVEVLLIGDSHAAHLWSGLQKQFPQVAILQATASGCKGVIDRAGDDAARCAELMDYAFTDYLAKHRVDWVLLSSDWQREDLPRVKATLGWLTKRGVKVVLAGPIVQYRAPLPLAIALAEERNDATLVDRMRASDGEELDALFRRLAARYGVVYFSPYDVLCHRQSCRVTDHAKMPIQFDDGHLTATGSRIVAGGFPIGTVLARSTATGARPAGTGR